MIILSQNKKILINFDNLTQIYITQDEEEAEYFVKCETVGTLYETLGIYKTEERAKEVLNEIIDYMTNKSNIVMTQNEINLNSKGEVYYMPEK